VGNAIVNRKVIFELYDVKVESKLLIVKLRVNCLL